jgi:hypothetical protein
LVPTPLAAARPSSFRVRESDRALVRMPMPGTCARRTSAGRREQNRRPGPARSGDGFRSDDAHSETGRIGRHEPEIPSGKRRGKRQPAA